MTIVCRGLFSPIGLCCFSSLGFVMGFLSVRRSIYTSGFMLSGRNFLGGVIVVSWRETRFFFHIGRMLFRVSGFSAKIV